VSPATSRAWGVGTATISSSGTVLDAHYRRLGWGNECPTNERESVPPATIDARRGVEIVPITVETDTATPPRDTADVYLRLHLLSHRLAKPRTLNLDGVFGLLLQVPKIVKKHLKLVGVDGQQVGAGEFAFGPAGLAAVIEPIEEPQRGFVGRGSSTRDV